MEWTWIFLSLKRKGKRTTSLLLLLFLLLLLLLWLLLLSLWLFSTGRKSFGLSEREKERKLVSERVQPAESAEWAVDEKMQ